MITALIRTHKGREESCKRAIATCSAEDVRVIRHYDFGGPRPDYSYNLHCNTLKALVNEGYFFFLDSDDFIIPGAIEKIKPHLEPDTAVICQFLRGTRPKPSDRLMDVKLIVKGKIGMPCIFLHHSKKNIADFEATEDADYRFIKEVAGKMKVKFVKVPVVCSPKRGRGL